MKNENCLNRQCQEPLRYYDGGIFCPSCNFIAKWAFITGGVAAGVIAWIVAHVQEDTVEIDLSKIPFIFKWSLSIKWPKTEVEILDVAVYLFIAFVIWLIVQYI